MREVNFSIDGKVQPKERPRVYRNRYTGQVHALTPAKTKEFEEKVRASYLDACDGRQFMFEGAVEMTVFVFVQIPKSTRKSLKTSMIQGFTRPTVKNGDVDNLFKAISDALNGFAYNDDSQIVSATIKKFYSLTAGADVTIREVTSI